MKDDFHFALRMLATHWWFSAAVIVTLALGIGINTTIFTLVNAVLFKPVDRGCPARVCCSSPFPATYQSHVRKKSDGRGNASFQIRTTLSDIVTHGGISGLLAFMMVSVACVVIVAAVIRHEAITLPPYLTEMTALVFGYYFGSRHQRSSQ